MNTSTAEAVQFWLLGGLAVVGSIAMVAARKAVYSALFLAVTMIILAVFYIAQGAVFLGVVQVVVYTGAVMMLFLFVLMRVGVDSAGSRTETIKGQRPAAVAAGVGFGLVVIGAIGNASVESGRPEFIGLEAANAGGNVEGLAELIFVRYLWAFELTGVLLIIATIGAMVLAHRERFEERKGQQELSQQRFRDGTQVTPLPSPGVYARHNAVDWPARLPDGSPSELSINPMHRGHRNDRDGGQEWSLRNDRDGGKQ